ncbi:MAG: hypothetical protein IV100_09180 [Myxococcales bacterium]|nr:hypothetical protein [Myxococcales bacterium]
MNEQLEALYSAALELAQQALEEEGEFPPFALVQAEDDEIEIVELEDGDDVNSVDEAVEVLTRRVRERLAAEPPVRAAALCTDVALEGRPDEPDAVSDAICAHLELKGGETIDVLMPYVLTDPDESEGEDAVGELEFEEPFAVEAEGYLFPKQ